MAVDKQNLSDIEKLQYLKLCVTGEASRILSGLPLLGQNYLTAMELLQSRYGSKRRIVLTRVQCLLSIKTPNLILHFISRICLQRQ